MLEKFSPKLPDVYASLAPLYNFFSTLGLLTFKITRSEKGARVTMLALLRHLLQYLLVVLVTYFAFKADVFYCYNCSALLPMFNFVQTKLWLCISTTNVILNLVLSKKTVDVINKVNALDFELKHFGIIIEHWYVIMLMITICLFIEVILGKYGGMVWLQLWWWL